MTTILAIWLALNAVIAIWLACKYVRMVRAENAAFDAEWKALASECAR